MKPVFTFIAFLFTTLCFAQKQNVYFLKNNGTYVKERDSADYIRVVREPDSASVLYNVFEFYLNGKNKLMGKSSRIDPPLLEGQCISYYSSGTKESIAFYKNGKKSGPEYLYYHNGKPYVFKEYPDNKSLYNDATHNFLITANYDSLGTTLVNNGNGYYKEYEKDFKTIAEEGSVKNGKRDSIWKGNDTDLKLSFIETYQGGQLISGTANYDDGKTVTYTKSREAVPQFKGGVEGFGRYLSNNIQYPDNARRNGTQGIVVLSFVVEKSGKLTDIKVNKSVSPDLDAEALSVLEKSPLWVPGMRFGRPVRVAYSVPISFTLSN